MAGAVRASRLLASDVEQSGFLPGSVVGIAQGGLLPAYEISQLFGCRLQIVHLARPFTALKRFLLLDSIPASAKTALRQLEMRLGLYRRLKRRRCSGDLELESGSKVLIVDDSLDTGQTMATVIDLLKGHDVPRESILIAAITQIFVDACPAADCAVFRGVNLCFPWSRDSRELESFRRYCDSRSLLGVDH